ncbi:MAG: hypothetical protein M3Y84_06255 [Acidobacteriota bacterium]|nr:hypothetical protein [Acidobacteriota bacterium]
MDKIYSINYASKAAGEYLNTTADGYNRLSGYTYDADGNMTADGVHSCQFDAESQVSAVDDGAAIYSYGSMASACAKWQAESQRSTFTSTANPWPSGTGQPTGVTTSMPEASE